MSHATSRPSRTILPLFALLLGFAFPVAAAAEARVSESYGKLPLHFEANQGQTHEDVRFLARGSGFSLYLTSGEAVFVLAKPNPDRKRGWHGKRYWRSTHERTKTEVAVLRMAIVDAHPAPLVSGLEELPGKVNYFIGNDPAKWRTNIPTYAKVHYREVYPGIDLVYYGNQRQLEYDFVIAPGATPQSIVLDFQGADRLEVNAEGELLLHLAGGTLRQRKPVIYQDVAGIRREIIGGYVLQGTNRVGFHVATYDASRPLIIDPVVLSYSTYLGGSRQDFGSAIAVDAEGNAYVTGFAVSADFPTTAGAFQPSGSYDAFVTKLNSTGSALVYSTFLGGSQNDSASGIALDTSGSAYVTGYTESTDFPTTPGAFQTSLSGGSYCVVYCDSFVTKLNPTGSALVYSTYLGGSGGEGFGGAIALDTSGSAYVTGYTESTDFPTTPGAFQTTFSGGRYDAFVTKLNPAGSALVYSTYLGGSGNIDGGNGIAVDADDNAYVTGSTSSTDFPTTAGAFQTSFGGGVADAFVTKLDSSGSALVYSTYLGGSGYGDWGYGIAVDASGSAYATGQTASNDFPTTAGAFQPTFGDGDCPLYDSYDPCRHAFVTKLSPTGSSLSYSTYLGGSRSEEGRAIAVDAEGNIYVTGRTDSVDFPTTAGAFQPTFGDSSWCPSYDPCGDAFVTMLNPTGSSLSYSTFLGGSRSEVGFGIAVDAEGNTYVTGGTQSADFPTAAAAFQPMFGGQDDAFVAKIVNDTAPPPTTTFRFEENAATYTGRWTSYGAETGTFSGTILASNETGATATFSFNGTVVTWLGVKCAICGIATVSIDGGLPYVVNTIGPAGSNFTSEPVFSASGLDPAVTHTMVITVTGTSTSPPSLLTGGNHIAVDAFDVTE